MARRTYLAFLVVVVLTGCTRYPEPAGPGPRVEGQPPEILDFYAAPAISPGATWKVYLEVRDLDCDMTYIVVDLWQAGVGSYPPSFSPMKEAGCPKISGYLSLYTPPDQALVRDQFEMKIFVRDRTGNRSKSISLPLRFHWKTSVELPKQWQPAANQGLGAIQIDLISSETYNRGGSS